MSNPVSNVQIEDVLSSIRRLVSEEIGQQGIKPLEPRRSKDDDAKLVLTPTQKIRDVATDPSEDLWEETQELAPEAPAPVWQHQDSEAFGGQPEDTAPKKLFGTSDIMADIARAKAAVEALGDEENNASSSDPKDNWGDKDTYFQSSRGKSWSDLEASLPTSDDEWEPAEAEDEYVSAKSMGEMPWDGEIVMDSVAGDEVADASRLRQSASEQEEAVEEAPFAEVIDEDIAAFFKSDETSGAASKSNEPIDLANVQGDSTTELDAEVPVDEKEEPETSEADVDDIPVDIRPGERLFQRLSSAHSSMQEDVPEDAELEDVDSDQLFASINPQIDEIDEPDPLEEIAEMGEVDTAEGIDRAEPFDTDLPYAETDLELNEDILREMVRDIVRQELQGALGERITRNVRKLVRREIQRSLSELGQ